MKTVRTSARQGALGAAPASVDLRRQRRRRQGRFRRDGAGRGQRRAFPRLGRVQPAVVDPPARLELRRERAHRRRLLRAPHRRGGRGARALADREQRRAPRPRRGRRAAGADRRSLRRSAVGAVPLGRRRALEGDDRRRVAEEDGREPLYERSDTSAREREGLGAASGWLRARPSDDAAVDRGRDRGARLALRGRRRRAATRPASTSTSATTAKIFADTRAPLRPSSASSTATATRAASASPRSPAAPRT